MNKHFLKYNITLGIFILSVFFNENTFAQNASLNNGFSSNPFYYNCITIENSSAQIQSNSFGYIKPAFTDIDDLHPEAYFPVMIIFVQFANEPGPDYFWWPSGYPPVYINELLAVSKKNPIGGNWWDTYSESTEFISDYWLEQSRGRFHITGKAFSVVLDYDYSYYQNNGGFSKINEDTYIKLNKLYSIDWSEFDKWKIEVTTTGFEFKYEPDGYVDMIYKVHRRHAPKVGMPAGGVAILGETFTQGTNYLVDITDSIYINGGFYKLGSGLTMTPGYGGNENDSTYSPYSPLTKTGVSSFSEHEHGHYLFGPGHTGYGKMSGSGAPYGCDECLSPWEAVYLGYMVPRQTDYSVFDYSLGDYSSRNSNDTGEVLEVPVFSSLTGESFLIANRRKISLYDRIMWGDTAHGDPYREINYELGKGVYIYHAPAGYTSYPSTVDQECADGLFNWDFAGYRHPDWSDVQVIEYFIKTGVSYDNDKSSGSKQCADGKSIFNWFGIGKLHECMYCDGTDKIFSNNTDVWTSREFQGDRWDAWNVGYNEIFSPYSSPSSKTWANNNSEIFIWYYEDELNTKKAKFKIYRTGFNGLTEDSILARTPPSKPMGVTASFTGCIDGYKYPVVYWLHNMEPDMINWTMPPFDKKFYNVYIAKTSNINIVPSQYVFIETVNISKDSVPYFIDYDHPVSCLEADTSVEVLRYVITAVDGKGWQSVKSDFAPVICSTDAVIDNIVNNTVSLSFSLMQNYPNPFNPVTKINYSLPYVNGKFTYRVQLIIYNILGEEVKRLVDEFKPSGKYEVEFNGINIPSGVYFYVLDASGYRETKKMVLLK